MHIGNPENPNIAQCALCRDMICDDCLPVHSCVSGSANGFQICADPLLENIAKVLQDTGITAL